MKGVKGEKRTNKVLAKSSAAWRCIFELRANHLLDENLDSVFQKSKPEGANARLAVSEKKDEYEKKVKPDFWLESGTTSQVLPTELFVSYVRILPHSSSWTSDGVVLFTRTPLPAVPTFSIYVDNNVEKHVSFTRRPHPVPVTADQIDALSTYTLNGVFHDIFNKQYVHDPKCLSYWLAPPRVLTEWQSFESIVNTEELLAAGALEREAWDPCSSGKGAGKWCNAFLVDPGSGKFRYFTTDVVWGQIHLRSDPKRSKERTEEIQQHYHRVYRQRIPSQNQRLRERKQAEIRRGSASVQC